MLRRVESKHRWAGGAMLMVAIGMVMIAGMGVQQRATAQTESTGRMCSNGTLHGDYGLLAVGERAVPPFLGGGTEKFVATAMSTFYGDGTFLIQATGGGLHGGVTGIDPAHGGILGTYEVNSNCTGTMQWQPPAPVPPIVQSFVIVDNGRHVKSAVMSPLPNVTTVEFVRK